jgi:hypothetical protein
VNQETKNIQRKKGEGEETGSVREEKDGGEKESRPVRSSRTSSFWWWWSVEIKKKSFGFSTG